jgi:hypothetical protein
MIGKYILIAFFIFSTIKGFVDLGREWETIKQNKAYKVIFTIVWYAGYYMVLRSAGVFKL